MKNQIHLPTSPIRLKAFLVILVVIILLGSQGLTSIFASGRPSADSENIQARITATPVVPAVETSQSSKSLPYTVRELKAAADTEKPVLGWVAPVPNGLVWEVASGPVTLTVTATDNTGVVRVHFTRWDPAKLVFVDLGDAAASPYSLVIDSGALNIGWNQVNAVAYDAAGNASDFHYIWVYRSIPGPNVPATISPAGNITTLKPAFVWSPVKGAVKYRLAIYNIDLAKYVVSMDVNSSVCSASTNKCSYTPSTALVLYNDYKWKVLAKNASNISGPFSPFQSFKPAIPIPETVSPSGSITTTRPTYVWSRVKVASSYRLYIQDVAADKYVLIATVSSSACSSTTNKCSYTPSTALTQNKAYKWKILATTANDLSSPHSAFMSFKVIK